MAKLMTLAGLALWFMQASFSVALAQFPQPQGSLFDGAIVAGTVGGIFEMIKSVSLSGIGFVLSIVIVCVCVSKILQCLKCGDTSRKRRQTGMRRRRAHFRF